MGPGHNNESSVKTGLQQKLGQYRLPIILITFSALLAFTGFFLSDTDTILLPAAFWVLGSTPLVYGIVHRDRIRSVWIFDTVAILVLALFLEAGLWVGPFDKRFYSSNVGPESSWHPYLFWIESQKKGKTNDPPPIKPPPPIRKVEQEADLVEFLFQRSSHDPFRFRSGAVEKTKPGGTFRIAVIGGSNAYGYGVALYKFTFAAVLENLLKEKYPQKKIEMICAAARGYNLYQNLAFYKLHLREYQPDLVILYGNMIDSAVSRGPFTFRELFKMRSGMDIGDLWIRENEFPKAPTALINIQDTLRKSRLYSLIAGWVVGMRNSDPAPDDGLIKDVNPLPDYQQNLVDLIRIVKKGGAGMICADEFNFSEIGANESRASKIRKIMKETSEAEGCSFVPVHSMMSSDKEPKEYIFFPVELDHIRIEGHKRVARILLETIEKEKLIPSNH